MRQVYYWLKAWLGSHQTNLWLSHLSHKIDKLQRLKIKSDRELAGSRQALLKQQDVLESLIKKQTQIIARSEGLNKRLDEQLQATLDSLKTANDVVIPGLVACNQLFTARMEAEASIVAMRQVAARKEE